MALDYAIGTTFQTHVKDAYTFIMRYYKPGDMIYIFGFSRGAYIARYLCGMIAAVGLLSKGNEAMVSYAWQTYSQYQSSNKRHKDSKKKYMKDFKKSFSREGVEVYFLGMFDCVNSVATVFQAPGWFRRSSGYLPEAPAIHMRHAVSIGERRGQFKPALIEGFVQSKTSSKEVWFAGQHGDIGGGWKPEKEQPFLLSDIPLAWMLKEVMELEIREHQKMRNIVHDGDIILTRLCFVEDRLRETLKKGEMDIKLSLGDKSLLDPHDYLRFSRAIGAKGKLKSLAWWLVGKSSTQPLILQQRVVFDTVLNNYRYCYKI